MERSHLRTRDPLARLTLFWALVVPAALLQGVLESALRAGALETGWLLRWRLQPILVWALASPLFIMAARRLPVRGGQAVRNGAIHALIAVAWVLASNFLFRVPDLLAGVARSAVAGDVLRGSVTFGPGALLLYAVVVALAHGRPAPTPPPDSEAAPARERGAPPRHLPLRVDGRIHVVAIDEIRWLEADGDHVRIHAGHATHRVRGRLADFERRLDDTDFVRVHRSALIRSSEVRELQPLQHGDYRAVLEDGAEIRVARTRRSAIDRILGRHG